MHKTKLIITKTLFRSHYSFPVLAVLFASLFSLNACTKEAKTSDSALSLTASQDLSGDRTFPANIDTGALVAWYDFNNGSLKDKSIYHNDIGFNNAKRTTDRNGVANNAYYFSGHNYMRIPNSSSLNPDKAITLFAIVKVSDFYEGQCHGNRIIDKGYDDRQPGVYYVSFDDGYYTHFMNCNGPVDKQHEMFSAAYGNFDTFSYNAEGDTTEFVQTSHWYHIIYTYGNGVGNFYVDGKLTQTSANPVSFSANGNDLYLGAGNNFNPYYPYWFTGSIDQIGIFNVALNAYQVAKLSRL